MAKKKSSMKSSLVKPDALTEFRKRLKPMAARPYTEKGAKIALTHMVNNGTMTDAEGKAAARALKKAFAC